ncbi:hypothetical protein [Pseudoduganella chitinolytica]|uniref:Secreted protein n=1 Tax=Pseudoduganella chitinolytica TaxID=34070 RepID=A0ABY8BKU7_9BURK|nr:hypothetical protein [Pseudoduganella chitinolytica]WEF34899.1 hypothetical protein PX653_09105 [Pseudoduganella chitinolytica]
MFLLLAFFMTTSGAVSSTVAEFHSAEACDAARTVVLTQAPGPNKTAVCVAK